jgi:hypothetical protein
MIRTVFAEVPEVQAYADLPQPGGCKVFACPPLNPVKGKPLVGYLAALLAK